MWDDLTKCKGYTDISIGGNIITNFLKWHGPWNTKQIHLLTNSELL